MNKKLDNFLNHEQNRIVILRIDWTTARKSKFENSLGGHYISFLKVKKARTQDPANKKYVSVAHIWGDRRGQQHQSAMVNFTLGEPPS